MILHLVTDEKFIDDAYKAFHAVAPDENRFLLVANHPRKLKYIKNTPVEFITEREFFGKKFAKSLDEYDFVVLHSLSSTRFLQLVMNAGPKVKFVWIGFGADYYKYLDIPLLLPMTQKLHDQLQPEKKRRIPLLQRIKQDIKKKFYLRDIDDIEKVINRIDFFAPVLCEEYELVKKAFNTFHPKLLDWNYGGFENLVEAYKNFKPRGENILLGNSASFTNNHLEAFEQIRQLDLEHRKIYAPLSYGNPAYRDFIIKKGRKIFGDRFVPLTTFMPLEEYQALLSTCSICIQNHLRQQGAGNSILMLYLGAKVFLNENNPLYKFLTRNGAFLYTMKDLNDETISGYLCDEALSRNKNVVERFISRESVLAKTKKLIETVKAYERS